MPRYIDLTGTLTTGMWSYRSLVPDYPEFSQWRYATVEKQGWEADAFSMSTLGGTYLETRKHHHPNDYAVAEIEIERLFVDAAVARIPKQAGERITVADLEASGVDLRPGDALLVGTGWDAHWEEGDQYVMDSPFFERAAMEWIVKRGPSIVGADIPCFDNPRAGAADGINSAEGILTVLYDGDVFLLAPLINIDAIPTSRTRLVVLPLKIADACGAPCRAIAVLD